MFEVGELADEPFIVMELLEGVTLGDRLRTQPLPAVEVARIGDAALDVLGALHARGLVHRDLKPSNLFLLDDGRIKLLDFGLVLPIEMSGRPKEGSALTMTGMVMGSPGYMAPEQIRGHEVDGRADLFALAVSLHEAATGVPPFRGASPVDVMYAVLHHPAPRLRGSRELEALGRVLERALAKAPEERYGDAAAMAAALRAAVGAPTPTAPAPAEPMRLAVLPFRLLRASADLDFLGPSLADAIALSLAGLRSLVVRSAHASARFATAAPDLDEIASALDVDVVLLGTLLPAGERCRVVTQLVEAPGGRVLWSQTSDVSERDVLALQDLLTKRIVESLQLPLSSRERSALLAQAATNPTAYDFFLRANRASFVGQELYVARSLYLKALEADPDFAPAWARLGRCYRVIGKYLTKNHTESYAQAQDALMRALEIHPDHPGAHHVKAQLDLDTGRPEAALERLLGVVERNPNDPEGFAGLVTALRYLGMPHESIRAHERARQLDPDIPTSALHSYLALGEHELALSESSRHPEADRALVLLEMGRNEDTLEDARGYERREHGNVLGEWARLVVAVLEGDPSGARVMAQSHRDFPDPEGRYYVAELAAAVDSPEEALMLLEGSAGVGYANVQRMNTTRHFRAVRMDPRFRPAFARAQAQHDDAVAAFGDRVGRIFGTSSL